MDKSQVKKYTVVLRGGSISEKRINSVRDFK